MKIKTITCHRVYNYGASLQAFALQHYLEKNGHNVEIIDYWPKQFHARYNLWYVHQESKYRKIIDKLPLLRYPLGLKNNWWMLKTWGRRKAFLSFENAYLHITPITYFNSHELASNPPVADCYIVGSDQVWNTDCENGRHSAYYLDFGDKNTKRISYAASFGIPLVKNEYKEFVAEKIQRLDYVSVREKTGLDILDNMGIHNAVQVCDPVFLLSPSDWEHLLSSTIPYPSLTKGYILVYDFLHNDNRIKDITLKLSKSRNLPIVSVNDYSSVSYAKKNINNAGPLEFLNLIKGASAVVSNSFHATAFSVIFGKDFYVYPLISQRNSSRMTDFLSDIGLLSRFECTEVCELDYSNVSVKLNCQIDKSKEFLFKALVS